MKRLLGIPFLLLAGFCVFGFRASFEPGVGMTFKIGYAVVGIMCLAVAFWSFFRK